MRKHYVLGLVFNDISTRILLIEKLRPDWQKGRWNGIGGKIDGDETPSEAMLRESKEETGHEYDFEHRITFVCPGGTVYVFVAKTTREIEFEQIEDEKLKVWGLWELPSTMMANLKLYIPLCLANIRFPVMIDQLCLGVDG